MVWHMNRNRLIAAIAAGVVIAGCGIGLGLTLVASPAKHADASAPTASAAVSGEDVPATVSPVADVTSLPIESGPSTSSSSRPASAPTGLASAPTPKSTAAPSSTAAATTAPFDPGQVLLAPPWTEAPPFPTGPQPTTMTYFDIESASATQLRVTFNGPDRTYIRYDVSYLGGAGCTASLGVWPDKVSGLVTPGSCTDTAGSHVTFTPIGNSGWSFVVTVK